MSDWLVLGCSPVTTFAAAFEFFYAARGYAHQFWIGLGMQCALSLVLLAGASRILPRVWQEGEQRAVQRKDWRGRARIGRSFSVWEKRFAWCGASANPTGWLVWRDERLPNGMIVLAGIAMALWLALTLGCLVVESFAWRSRLMTLLVGLCAVGHLLLKLVLNVESPRRFSLDRQSRALELLLATPLSNRSIALGIWQGLRETFAVPVIALAAMNLMTAVLVLGLPGPPNLVLSPGWIAALLLAGMPLLLTDCYAIGWCGLRLGLARQRHHLAVRGVFVTVLLPPWILGAILWAMAISSGAVDEVHLFMFWFLVTLLLDVAIAVVSRTEVFDQLRRLVTEGRIQPVEPDAPAVEPVALVPANS
jgi:hypothetical protein